MDGDALERDADMTADELAALGQRLRRAVDIERLVRELAAAAARVREQRSDPSLDVDPRIASRRAGHRRDGVELLLARQ